MATIKAALLYLCTRCPYKTADEDMMHSHIWSGTCKGNATSYKTEQR